MTHGNKANLKLQTVTSLDTYAVQGGSPARGAAVGAVERVEALPERRMIDGRVQHLQRE